MKKYTFTCQLFDNKEWNTIITIVASSKEEAIEVLSKKYSKKVHYYSSDIKVEEIENIKEAREQEKESYNNLYKNNIIALGMLIGGVASNIAGNQTTTKGKTLNQVGSKRMNMSVDELYKSSLSIFNFANK